MKEYRVVKVPNGNTTQVERVMNDMAREGWEVKAVTFWYNWSAYLLITFERDV